MASRPDCPGFRTVRHVRGQPSRSWTPLSRADRNRLRRGEDLRVAVWLSTWCSAAWDRYERRVRRG